MAATNAAIQNSMQQLAATTRLGVKKKIYPNSLRLSEPNPNPNRLSDSYPSLSYLLSLVATAAGDRAAATFADTALLFL